MKRMFALLLTLAMLAALLSGCGSTSSAPVDSAPAEESTEAAPEDASAAPDAEEPAAPNRDTFVHFSNMDVNGDCYNASGYRAHITPADFDPKPADGPFNPFAMGPRDAARNLEMRLENVRYSGAISTAEGHHIDRLEGNRWLSPVPLSKWYNIAFLECIPKAPYQAGLIVRLEKGSVWNVTKTSYLTALTVDETSTLNGQVFVNGTAVRPEPNVNYTGTILVEPGRR